MFQNFLFHYSYQGKKQTNKSKCLFLALIGVEKYSGVRIHGGIEKDHWSPSAVTTEQWREGLMETCPGGQQHRSRRGLYLKEKTGPLEAPEVCKRGCETLKC